MISLGVRKEKTTEKGLHTYAHRPGHAQLQELDVQPVAGHLLWKRAPWLGCQTSASTLPGRLSALQCSPRREKSSGHAHPSLLVTSQTLSVS